MAVVVKNTFLDIAEHKFLHFGVPLVHDRRSQSLPRKWKLIACSRDDHVAPASPDNSTRASLRSDLSFFSDSPEDRAEDLPTGQFEAQPSFGLGAQLHCGASSSESRMGASDRSASPSCGTSDYDEGVVACPMQHFICKTPTSSIGSPHGCGCSIGTMLDTTLCCVASYNNELEQETELKVCTGPRQATKEAFDCSSCDQAAEQKFLAAYSKLQEELDEKLAKAKKSHDELEAEVQTLEDPSDAEVDAVASAVYSALVSSGRAHQITIDKSLKGKACTLISAEVESGPRAFAQSYDVVQLAKRALDAATAKQRNVTQLSARIQKEDFGYSLRTSIACMPEGAEDRMCWDMFKKGYCPRRRQCRWHHPQDSDIARIKVNVRHAEVESSDVSSEEQFGFNSSDGRRKISIDELL